MDAHLEERFARAFVDVLRDELAQHREIMIPQLGRFAVEHRSSEFEERSDGGTVLLPPREVIVFHQKK